MNKGIARSPAEHKQRTSIRRQHTKAIHRTSGHGGSTTGVRLSTMLLVVVLTRNYARDFRHISLCI